MKQHRNTCPGKLPPLKMKKLITKVLLHESVENSLLIVCDLRDYHTFMVPQCHRGQKTPGSANKCIARP